LEAVLFWQLVFFATVFAVSMWIIGTPDKWNGAVALKICRDGTPILRRADGTIFPGGACSSCLDVSQLLILCALPPPWRRAAK